MPVWEGAASNRWRSAAASPCTRSPSLVPVLCGLGAGCHRRRRQKEALKQSSVEKDRPLTGQAQRQTHGPQAEHQNLQREQGQRGASCRQDPSAFLPRQRTPLTVRERGRREALVFSNMNHSGPGSQACFPPFPLSSVN